MDQGADKLLTQFAGAANKTALHPLDWGRFHEFVIYVHTFGRNITDAEDADVRERLEQLGFTHEKASTLVSFYAQARSLLTIYDKTRGQATTGGA